MCPSTDFLGRTRPTTDDFVIIAKNKVNNGSPLAPSASWEDYATGYMEFIDSSPTVYHASDYLTTSLEEAGFIRLNEREDWTDKLLNYTRFYVTRNNTTTLAFVKSQDWNPEQDAAKGAAIIGTHIDSLAAVVKPHSQKPTVDGFEMIGVAPYGGALSDLWLDRDLGIAGKLIVRENNKITTKKVRIPHPVARIASLAPHFGAPAVPPFNLETQKVPFIGLVSDNTKIEPTKDELKSPLVGKHSLRLLRTLAKYADVKVQDMIQMEIHLFDTQPASLGGLDREFLYAPRMDNKACTYSAFSALIEAAEHVEANGTLAICCAFDHEEIGSLSRTGAQGNILESALGRFISDLPIFYANSFFLSADVTHAVNPNFSNVYLENHKPKFNRGLTVCHEPSGRMITDGESCAFVEEVARLCDSELQHFQIRNDSRSGGTIGPYFAAKTGVRGVDLGIAQLAMHSIRACIGSKDIYLGVKFFKGFYAKWKEVDNKFDTEE